MKKHSLFKGVSVFGAMLLLANVVIPGLVHAENDVACIDETCYPSLRAAVEGADAGATITLIADDHESFSGDNLKIDIKKNLTIDGKGRTIYGNSNVNTDAHPYHWIYVGTATPTEVTIKDLTIDGFADQSNRISQEILPLVVSSTFGGKIILSGLTFQNFHRQAINIGGGNFEINNVKIIGKSYAEHPFQQGIEIWNSAQGTIDGVEISGIENKPEDGTQAWDAYAIIVSDGDVGITNTTISNSDNGLVLIGGGNVTLGEGNNFDAKNDVLLGDNTGKFQISSGIYLGNLGGESSIFEITGGTFSIDPSISEYVVDGFFAFPEGENFVVEPAREVSEIAISGIVKPVAGSTATTTNIKITTDGVELKDAYWTVKDDDQNNAGDQGDDDQNNAGDQGDDDQNNAGDQGDDDQNNAGNQGDDDQNNAGNQGDDDQNNAGNQGDDDQNNAGNQGDDDQQASSGGGGGGSSKTSSDLTFEEGKEYVLHVSYNFNTGYIPANQLTISEDAKADNKEMSSGTVDLTYTATAKPASNGSSGGGRGGSGGGSSTTNTDNSKATTGDTATVNENNIEENNEEKASDENKDGEKAPMTDAQAVEKFGQEQIDAYKWALENGITTMKTVEAARLDEPLTRAELAKMMVVYIQKVLEKDPIVTGDVSYPDVDESLGDLYGYIKLAYQYQIMGINADGTPIEFFNPNGLVTRGEYATVFSRVLFGDKFNKAGEDFYTKHLEALKAAGILTNTIPTIQEMRGWVMLMMYRSSQNAEKIENVANTTETNEEEKADEETATASDETKSEANEEEKAEEATNTEATTGDVAETPATQESSETTAENTETTAEATTGDVAETPAAEASTGDTASN